MAQNAKKNVPDGRAKNGGARSGSGPKPGRHISLSRQKSNELCETGESPLDVMIDNMLFWRKATKSIEERLAHLMTRLEDPEQIAEFGTILKQFLHARSQSQACAVDAAPYIHPRLAALTIKEVSKSPEERLIEKSMTIKDAVDAYAVTLKNRPLSLQPELVSAK